MEVLINDRLEQLQAKFYNDTISEEEKKELFREYRFLCSGGEIDPYIISNFLYFTNPLFGMSYLDA